MKFWRPSEDLHVNKGWVPTFAAGSRVLPLVKEANWTGLLRELAMEW